MDIKHNEANLYTDKNAGIEPTLFKTIPAHGIEVEMDDTINEVGGDKTNHTESERNLTKVIPVYMIKAESYVNQVPNIEDTANHDTVQGVMVQDKEENNQGTSDAGDTTDNNQKPTLPIPTIKEETLDETYERIFSTEDVDDMADKVLHKVHGIKVKNVDAINQEVTKDTSCILVLPEFVAVQTMSGLPKTDANESSNSTDMYEDVCTDEHSSSDELTKTKERDEMGFERVKKGMTPAQATVTPQDKDPDGQLLLDSKVSCTLCPYETNNEKYLSYHLEAHDAAVSYKCDLCCYMTINKYHLTFHYKVHSSEKSYSCSICEKSFYSKGDLNKHLRIHSGEKPFVCDICNKMFTQKGTLMTHLKTHSRKKPYSCEICNKSYGYKTSLMNHIRVHTGEVVHSCQICNKAFNSKGTLKTHYHMVHTGKKPYSCNFCNELFKLKTLLMRHLQKAHSVEPDSLDIKNSSTQIKALPAEADLPVAQGMRCTLVPGAEGRREPLAKPRPNRFRPRILLRKAVRAID